MKASAAALLLAAAAVIDLAPAADAASCSQFPANRYCVYCSRNGKRYVCLPAGGTPCTADSGQGLRVPGRMPPQQSQAPTIKLCQQLADIVGTLRPDGCYEGMDVEAEPAIFRAITTTLPTNSSQCASNTITAVRLVRGPNGNAGQLEVQIGGYWGNVLFNDHGPNAARVVCRQLGKKGGQGRGYAYYGQGNLGMMVVRIDCPTGREPSLKACTAHLNWGFDWKEAPLGWRHEFDYGVDCTDPAAQAPSCSSLPNNRYCSYCYDPSGPFMACVAQGGSACQASTGTMKPCVDMIGQWGGASWDRVGACFNVLEFATSPSQSRWATFRGIHATPPSGQGVDCAAKTITAVRLVNGGSTFEGRLEVQMGGLFGTVSAAHYGISDNVAKVVCRQLGKKGGIVYTNMPYGPSTRLGELIYRAQCLTGNEASLNECQLSTQGGIASPHVADVSVACKEPFQFPPCTEMRNNVYCVSCSSAGGSRHVCLARGIPCSADGGVIRLCSQVAIEITPSVNGCPLDYMVDDRYSFRARQTAWPNSNGYSCSDRAVTGIRLVNGPNPNAGRLEVKIGGWWGTVSAEGWGSVGFSDKAAKVACLQLGKSGGVAHGYAFYGQGSSNLGVLMYRTRCTGLEKNLSACTFQLTCPSENPNVCGHEADIGIECDRPADLPPCFTLPANRYCVSCCTYHDGQTPLRHVCLASGGTTCKSDSGAVIKPCQDIVQDPSWGYLSSGCYLHYEPKGVYGPRYVFRTKQAAIPKGSDAHCASKVVTSIRLVRGPTAPMTRFITAGSLEVQVGGVWGTVCSEGFGEEEAAVACRQLGLRGGVPHGRSRYGAAPEGTPPLINFGNVYNSSCNGDEASLTQCSWELSGQSCDDGEAGVECSR